MIARSPKMFLKKKEPFVFLLPTLLLFAILMFVPITMAIAFSFFDNVIMNKNPVFVGLKNYATILLDPVFYDALSNTLTYTVSSVVGHLTLGLLFAMMLNTKLLGSAWKAFFRMIYILPWVFTVAVTAILWRLMLNPNGVINYILECLHLIQREVEWLSSTKNALFAVVIINMWAGYPFHMVSMLAGLQGIPADLYEAAIVDGAGGLQKFFYITLPQLKPVIVSMAMLDFIWTLQQFALVWMTTGGGPIHVTEMFSTYTYKLAFSQYQFSLASTSAVIILMFSMFVAFFYVRHQKARE